MNNFVKLNTIVFKQITIHICCVYTFYLMIMCTVTYKLIETMNRLIALMNS